MKFGKLIGKVVPAFVLDFLHLVQVTDLHDVKVGDNLRMPALCDNPTYEEFIRVGEWVYRLSKDGYKLAMVKGKSVHAVRISVQSH